MEERITIEEFITTIPVVRNKVTVIMLNSLSLMKHGTTGHRKNMNYDEIPIIEFIDEITKEKFFAQRGAGEKAWAQFCLYRDNFKSIKAYQQLMNKIQLDIR
jgi:hypothetical protein